MNYYEIKIFTSSEGIEPVSSILTMLGHETFMIEDKSVVEELLEKKNKYDWDYVDESVIAQQQEESKITLYLEPDENAKAYIDAIRSAITMLKDQDKDGRFGRLEVESFYESDEEWKDKWKEYFKTSKMTDNIVIKPTWEEYEPEENEMVIEIDPGMAFGTGTHATTRMCVKLLEKYITSEEDKVLDLGCGSGSNCQWRKIENRKYFYFTTLVVTRKDVQEYMKHHSEYTKANRFKDIICKIYI